MKKIDKLIFSSFYGPFILTFLVVVFILLNIHMLRYFDDIIGKDLGLGIIGTLLFYFAIFNTPAALPLAVLMSSLITFGNLGEHFELTAVKSLGISLTRALFPIALAVSLITGFAFYTGNYLVPKAALEAYSLLYDIKQKKPALDLREGAFTSSIPDISIKVSDRLPDGKTIRGVIIYDHRGKAGNKEVIVADSGRMFTMLNDQYLKLELFNGYRYSDGSGSLDITGRQEAETMTKTKFKENIMVFDLSSFSLMRTDKKWFQGNRIMRNLSELDVDMDSIRDDQNKQRLNLYEVNDAIFHYHQKKDTLILPSELSDLKRKKDTVGWNNKKLRTTAKIKRPRRLYMSLKTYPDSIVQLSDSLLNHPSTYDISGALGIARSASGHIVNYNSQISALQDEYKIFQIQWHKILANAVACMAMFLIGAPLGAIIKKGGLGMPTLASILFFIMFYVISLLGEKWAKQGIVPVPVGMWMANAVLFLIGFAFLRQARRDARLFESDFYSVVWDKLKVWFARRQAEKVDAG